jgi:general secretion pathway protein L
MIALVIILPATLDSRTMWLRVADGRIVARGNGLNWQRDGADRFVLIAPAAATSLHRAQLPGLTRKQAEAAARLLALDSSIGAPERLHVAVGSRDAEGNLDVAVIDAAGLGDWIAWARAENFDPDAIVPAALLLPLPEQGVVQGRVGEELVARDGSSGFPADGLAELIAPGPVIEIDAAAIDAALVAAATNPPLDLRQGPFARRRPGIDPRVLWRCLMLAGAIALAVLIVALLTIAGFDRDSAALDAASVAQARRVAQEVTTPAEAEAAINARLTAVARGGRGFAAPAATIVGAVEAVPDVTLGRLDQAPGEVRATLSGARSDDLDRVLIAIQQAGYALGREAPRQQAGRVSVSITVRAP